MGGLPNGDPGAVKSCESFTQGSVPVSCRVSRVVLVAQHYMTLYRPVAYGLPGSSCPWNSPSRILER